MTEYTEQLPAGIFRSAPAVYAVGREYQIMVPVAAETLMWCEIGGRNYYDESCGILRSAVTVHRMIVPMEVLDAAGKYTVCCRIVRERKAYFSDVGEILRFEFRFRSPAGPDIRIFQIADAHNRKEAPIASAEMTGHPLDLLILNGDIPEDSGDIRNFDAIHEIAGSVSKGEIPVVFSRGNHDLRGVFAEKLAEYTPSRRGESFYSFRLGPLWGLVLDCGEDKEDSDPSYGHTMVCHDFRMRETEFIRRIIAEADCEYNAPGVQYRLVVSHSPFSQIIHPPFDIEQDIYREWCRLLATSVHPHLMLCGHMHALYITRPGDPLDHLGQPCPVVVGNLPGNPATPQGAGGKMSEFVGTLLELSPRGARIRFIDQNHRTVEGRGGNCASGEWIDFG